MEFVPLADILCNEIGKLNRLGLPATINSLQNMIFKECPPIAKPTIEILRQTINKLLESGLIYCMGEHFFVSVPISNPYHTTTKTGNTPLKSTKQCQTGSSIVDAPIHTSLFHHKRSNNISKNKKGSFYYLLLDISPTLLPL